MLIKFCQQNEEGEKETCSYELLPKSSYDKLLLDNPRILATIQTEYEGFDNELQGVAFLSEKEIWACGNENDYISLYNLQGEEIKCVYTKSGNMPWDIAVTKLGELLYTDAKERTLNIFINSDIQEVIRLESDWIPRNLCCTSSGDILVIMDSNDAKQSKVVRYAGAIEKQVIQFNETGERLYSSSSFKYICENKNLDICVADKVENAVVVVSHSGLLRFIYTGHSSQMSFNPVGIATDSTCLILVVDHDHEIIHALDQEGTFIGYIKNCTLQSPWGICVDSKDRLFVAESSTGQVKKIEYKNV